MNSKARFIGRIGLVLGAHFFTNTALAIAQTSAPSTQSADPITILYSMTAKEGKEQELAKLIPRLVRQGRTDDGNLAYTSLQQRSKASSLSHA